MVARTLTAAPITVDLGGHTVSTSGYDGTVPGPVIRVSTRDRLDVRFLDQLSDPTTRPAPGRSRPSTTSCGFCSPSCTARPAGRLPKLDWVYLDATTINATTINATTINATTINTARVLAFPPKRSGKRISSWLSAPEVDALLTVEGVG